MGIAEANEKEAPMMRQMSAKLRDWGEALAGVDDPLGDYLINLDGRVRRLEGELTQLRETASASATATGSPSPTLTKD